jgi:hypothetical protein
VAGSFTSTPIHQPLGSTPSGRPILAILSGVKTIDSTMFPIGMLVGSASPCREVSMNLSTLFSICWTESMKSPLLSTTTCPVLSWVT